MGNENEPNPLKCHFRFLHVDTKHNCNRTNSNLFSVIE